MLVLERRIDEVIEIRVGEVLIEVMVCAVRGNNVRIGVNAPQQATINRKEVAEAIERERRRNQK